MFILILFFLILLIASEQSHGFLPLFPRNVVRYQPKNSTSALNVVARGMGMAKKASKKKKGSKQKTKTPPFDVNASLLRLEKRYDDLMVAAAKTLAKEEESVDDLVTTEYVVAARGGTVTDWVPIAQLCLARSYADAHFSEGSSDAAVQAAVSYYCREFSHVAAMGSRVFQSIARNELQYAVESADSFHKHVYEVVVEGKHDDNRNDEVMTKTEARSVLELDSDANDKSTVKQVYRKMSYTWHPDRFVGTDISKEEREDAADKYARIKLAYETLSSGVREGGKSWYESLGGRARTDFCGPVNLSSLGAAKDALEAAKMQSAVVGLDPDLVQAFVARSRTGV